TSIKLQPGGKRITNVSCSPTSKTSTTLTCSVVLSEAAPLEASTITLQASSARLQMPRELSMAGGQQSATFNVGVIASDQDESPTVTALLAGDSFTAELPITGV